MAKTYQDTFTRTAAALAGSTSSDGLFTWSVPDGTDPNTNGTAIALATFGAQFTGMTSADTDTDDIYVEVDYTVMGGSSAVWIDLGSDGVYPAGTGYEAAIFGGNAQIFAVAGGSFTQLGASVSHTPSTGTYRFERSGSTLTLKKDGTTVLTRTDSSEPTGAGKRRAATGGDPAGGGFTIAEFRYGDIGGGSPPPAASSQLTLLGVG
jgi:hypothetical protein